MNRAGLQGIIEFIDGFSRFCSSYSYNCITLGNTNDVVVFGRRSTHDYGLVRKCFPLVCIFSRKLEWFEVSESVYLRRRAGDTLTKYSWFDATGSCWISFIALHCTTRLMCSLYSVVKKKNITNYGPILIGNYIRINIEKSTIVYARVRRKIRHFIRILWTGHRRRFHLCQSSFQSHIFTLARNRDR